MLELPAGDGFGEDVLRKFGNGLDGSLIAIILSAWIRVFSESGEITFHDDLLVIYVFEFYMDGYFDFVLRHCFAGGVSQRDIVDSENTAFQHGIGVAAFTGVEVSLGVDGVDHGVGELVFEAEFGGVITEDGDIDGFDSDKRRTRKGIVPAGRKGAH